jgi:hypothetical protein
MKLQGKNIRMKTDIGNAANGQVCPMPAKGAMGSAVLTIIL